MHISCIDVMGQVSQGTCKGISCVYVCGYYLPVVCGLPNSIYFFGHKHPRAGTNPSKSEGGNCGMPLRDKFV
jgi:hypothetical protein